MKDERGAMNGKGDKFVSQYLKISPSTRRYHQLMALARQYNCPWQDIAREAIDSYLRQNAPKKV